MRILDTINWNKAVELITFYDWLVKRDKTIDDVRAELAEWNDKVADSQKQQLDEYIAMRRVLKDKGVNTDWCEKCDKPLIAIESLKEECETELRCPACAYVKCLDISLADYNIGVNNRLYPPEDEDFLIEPGENRIAKAERDRRRKICFGCEHLNGRMCKRCGCSTKHRTYYKILSCPDGRW